MVRFKVYEIMSIVAHISVTDPEAVPFVPRNLLSKGLPSYSYAYITTYTVAHNGDTQTLEGKHS